MKPEFLKQQQEILFQIDTVPPARKARNFRMDVTVTTRDMIAAVNVITSADTCDITEFDILSRLYTSGVRIGLDYELIAEIVRGKRFNEDLPIAFGVEPIKGEPARIEPRVTLEEFTTAELLRQFPGQVIRRGVPVDLDEVIAEKIPATKGRAGFTVRGRLLEPAPGEDVAFEHGEGAVLSADGLRLVAAMPGMAGLSHGKIEVKDAEYEAWKYDVKLRKDNMEAVLTIVPGLTKPPEHDAEWFKDLAASHGLAFGVDRDSWRFIPDRLNSTYVRVIANGEYPLHGEDARIEERFRENGDPGQTIFRVSAGQLIAEKIPPRKGARGRDVLDRPVDPEPGKDTSILAGPGTILSEDGLRLTAESSGFVSLVKGAYTVVPIMEVHHASSMPQQINFDGVVRVLGDVLPGHVVVASHHIEVLGDVRAADVVAGGILHIHGHVSNCQRTKVQSGDHMFVGSAENSCLRSQKDIRIGSKIRECDLIAGGSVRKANSQPTVIIGGRVVSGGGVEIKDLGASPSVVTTLLLGAPLPLRSRYDHAARDIMDLINTFGVINSKFLPLHKMLIAKQLAREQAPLYKKMRLVRDGLAEKIRVGRQNVALLKAALAQTSRGVSARIEGTAYPGSAIRIGTQPFRVQQRIKKSVFSPNPDAEILDVTSLN